jgi:hypothetical protein
MPKLVRKSGVVGDIAVNETYKAMSECGPKRFTEPRLEKGSCRRRQRLSAAAQRIDVCRDRGSDFRRRSGRSLESQRPAVLLAMPLLGLSAAVSSYFTPQSATAARCLKPFDYLAKELPRIFVMWSGVSFLGSGAVACIK